MIKPILVPKDKYNPIKERISSVTEATRNVEYSGMNKHETTTLATRNSKRKRFIEKVVLNEITKKGIKLVIKLKVFESE